jgi:hypothetical protein
MSPFVLIYVNGIKKINLHQNYMKIKMEKQVIDKHRRLNLKIRFFKLKMVYKTKKLITKFSRNRKILCKKNLVS